jgi:hypothetical protein
MSSDLCEHEVCLYQEYDNNKVLKGSSTLCTFTKYMPTLIWS